MIWYIFLFIMLLVVGMWVFKLGVRFGLIIGRKAGYELGRTAGYLEAKGQAQRGELFRPGGTKFDEKFLKQSGVKW